MTVVEISFRLSSSSDGSHNAYYSTSLDGNGDYLSLASTTDFAFGTGDFTVECWCYHSDGTVSSSYPYLFEMRDPGGGGNRISLYVTNSNTIQLWVAGTIFNAGYFKTLQWNHVALSRVSGNLRLFYNGQLLDTYTTEIYFTGAPLLIGQRDGYAAQSWPGFISDVRIVKGTGVYVDDFSPPVTPLTNITNTKLLCCNSSTVTGSTVTPGTITANGDAAVSNTNPFDEYPFGNIAAGTDGVTTTGVDFDGNDKIKIDQGSSEFSLQSDFTIEGWIKTDTFTTDCAAFSCWRTNS